MSAAKQLSIEYLRECFEYRDGVLYWRERPQRHFSSPGQHAAVNTRYAGKRASRPSSRGYEGVKLRINGVGVTVSVHRVIWAMHHGKWPEHTIDHINRDPMDNRIENLRDVTLSVNLFNRGNPESTGISGVRRTEGGKFTARIRIGDRYVHLGTFSSTEEALEAMMQAEGAAMAAVNKPHLARLIPLRVRERNAGVDSVDGRRG